MLYSKPQRRIGLPIQGCSRCTQSVTDEDDLFRPLAIFASVAGNRLTKVNSLLELLIRSLEFCLVTHLLSNYCLGLGDSLER
jgi:hypothetical protein